MCLFPVILKSRQQVGCGRCYQCIAKRVSDWSIRLKHHFYNNPYAYFVTLTYNDEHLKFKVRPEGRLATLCKRDLQLYFKRLRKRFRSGKTSYYAVGEYGSLRYRPHYHVLLFSNAPISRECIESAWSIGDRPLGNVDIGDITPASIAYTVGYSFGSKNLPRNRSRLACYYGIEREFAHMSKGLGSTVSQLLAVGGIKDYLMSDFPNRCYYPVDGQKRHLPRYYYNKMFSTAEKEVFKQISKNYQEINRILTQQIDPNIRSKQKDNNFIINQTKLNAKRKHRLYAKSL